MIFSRWDIESPVVLWFDSGILEGFVYGPGVEVLLAASLLLVSSEAA